MVTVVLNECFNEGNTRVEVWLLLYMYLSPININNSRLVADFTTFIVIALILLGYVNVENSHRIFFLLKQASSFSYLQNETKI